MRTNSFDPFVQIYKIDKEYYNFKTNYGKLLYDIHNSFQKFHCQSYQMEQILDLQYIYRKYHK